VNAIAVSTICDVGASKGLPKEMADHVVSVVAEIIERDFTGADGKPWSERRIAQSIGVPQPVLHTLRKGRGIGVHALLALRAYTGQSLDAILGLAMPEREAINRRQIDEIQEQVAALITVVETQAGKNPGPHSKAGKALESLRRARERAAGQRHLDEKARNASVPAPKRKGAA